MKISRLLLCAPFALVGCGFVLDLGSEGSLAGDAQADSGPAKTLHPKSDFDGDGRADLFCRTADDQLLVALSDPSGVPSWRATPWLTGWCGTPRRVGVGDFDHDRKSDLYCWDAAASTLGVARSMSDSGLGEGFVAAPGAAYKCAGSLATGNFDGDGKEDVICHDGDMSSPTFADSWVDTSTGAAFDGAKLKLDYWCGKLFGVADFDGDGLDDLWCHGDYDDPKANGKTWIARATGKGFDDTTKISTTDVDWISDAGFCTAPGSEFTAGDVDGDGRADLICRHPNRAGADSALAGEIWVALAKGPKADGTLPTFPSSSWKKYRSKWCTELDATIGFGDFNGDGMLDAYCHSTTGTTVSLARDTGTFEDTAILLGGCTGPGTQIGSAITVPPGG